MFEQLFSPYSIIVFIEKLKTVAKTRNHVITQQLY